MTIQIGLAGIPLSSHGHQPPTPLPPPVGFAANVVVNGQPVHHVGNTMVIHPIPGTIPPVPHLPPDVIIEGFATVFCNGTPLAKFMSKTQHGSQVMQGSRNVFVRDTSIATWIANGGSDGGASAPPPPAE
jgi:uncharacterized Zn-binding protein involved in type VI secretion